MAYDYTAFAGNTLHLRVELVDEAGEPLDVTGAHLVYVLRTPEGVEVVRKTSDASDITVTGDVVNDVATISIGAGETTALGGGRAWHELQCTDAAGNVSTLLAGWVTFLKAGIETEVEP